MAARLEIVTRAHQALSEGDVDALVALCAPDFQLDMSDRVLNPAIYQGHGGIRRFYSEVTEVWESFTWEPVELKEVDELVLVLVHSRGRGSHSGVELDRRSAMVWRFSGEQLASLTFFRDPGEAELAARVQSES
jgi:ketosteroid isomerase-like protein